MDRRTCARCGELDGEIFPLSAMNQGENAPPLHPRCRCTIVATFDSPGKRSKTSGERAARDYGNNPKTKSFADVVNELGGSDTSRVGKVKTAFGMSEGGTFDLPKAGGEVKGRRTRVPADMTYKDWRAVYIDKTKTFDVWQKEIEAKYAAMPPTREQLRGREIIDKLSSGAPLTSIKPNDKVVGVIKPLTSEQIKEIRDAEDKAFKSKTGADFGFKMMRTSPDWAKEILMTNPPNKNYGHTPNCQRCVVAHEARMRGYDVIARPSWGEGDPMQRVGDWLNVFEDDDREVYNCVGSNPKEVETFILNKMNEWGKGSRAFVWFDWDKSKTFLNDGHVIVIQLNSAGFVIFGDPQRRERGAIKFLNMARLDSAVIMRVDNLKFTDLVKRCCMNKE